MIRLRKFATVCAATSHGRLRLPRHELAMFGTSADNGERKWQAFQDNIKDAIVRSNLPIGLDKVLLQAFEVSKALKTLVEKDEPITREMVAVVAILPVHQVDKVPWMEGEDGQEARESSRSVHPRRLSRWQILKEQCLPNMPIAEQQGVVLRAWNEIIREQGEHRSEPIVPVDHQLFNDLIKDSDVLSKQKGMDMGMPDFIILAQVAKALLMGERTQLFVERPPPDRPDAGLSVLFPSCQVPVFCELGCTSLNAGVVRVLMACEAEGNQRVESFHEAVGVVSSGDKWVFLRSQDECIVIDDDAGNVLEYDSKGHPTRESAEKIMGKLHSLLAGSF